MTNRQLKTRFLTIAAVLTTASVIGTAWADPPANLRLCQIERPAAPCTFQESEARLHNLSSQHYYQIEFYGYARTLRSCATLYCIDEINPYNDIAEIAATSDPAYAPLVAGCQVPHTEACLDPPGDPYEEGHCPRTLYCCSNSCDNYDVGCSNPYCVQLSAMVKVHAWSTDGSSWNAYDPPRLIAPDATCEEHDEDCRD